ncbi:uncharacterized protein [Triticum aestivum]|uniref:uncharacterized protein isoform X1 n=1 Tax=Triticum aestivum TaxID=4565 RepID=UPI001D016C24|nr:uncharacterized protein LOC123161632 isoform X1 [Triticum aestivum]
MNLGEWSDVLKTGNDPWEVWFDQSQSASSKSKREAQTKRRCAVLSTPLVRCSKEIPNPTHLPPSLPRRRRRRRCLLLGDGDGGARDRGLLHHPPWLQLHPRPVVYAASVDGWILPRWRWSRLQIPSGPLQRAIGCRATGLFVGITSSPSTSSRPIRRTAKGFREETVETKLPSPPLLLLKHGG